MSNAPVPEIAPRLTARMWLTAFLGITRREALRFVHQRGRFLAALVRPLVWLFIFAAGFRAVLGLSITPPYQTYVLYEVYVTPGLCAMIQLFNGMQSSLSMVYDRETGAMRTLLVSPFPRWFLLGSKLVAGVVVSIIQVYVFLAIAWFWGVDPPLFGFGFPVAQGLQGHQHHRHANGHVDKEDPSPVVVITDPAAEYWPTDRRDNDRH